MDKLETPWKKGAIFICEKCGRRDDGAKGNPGADHYKSEFKGRLKDLGLGKDLRVMVSGCLGPCPKGQQTAAYFPREGTPEVIAFETKHEAGDFWEWVLKKARGE